MNIDFESLETRWNDEFRSFSQYYQGLVLAASGGVDSTVLFALLCHFFKSKKNFPIALAHVNFGLRGKDSDLDQAFCEDMAKSQEIRYFGLRLADDPNFCPPKTGIQLWARDIRRRFFASLQKQGYLLVLAHHQDDVCENILLRLARGSAPDNLLGMAEWGKDVWRPLLGFSKEEILDFAKKNNLAFREDESNSQTKYARNLVRHEILPALEKLHSGSKKRMVQTASQAKSYANFICQNLGLENQNLKIGVDATFFIHLPEDIAMLALAKLLGNCSKKRKALSHRFLKQALNLLRTKPQGFSLQLPGEKGFLEVRKGKVFLRT